VVVVGLVTGSVVAVATRTGLWLPLGGVAALLVGWWLLDRPGHALAALLGCVVVLEADPEGFLPQTSDFYKSLPGHLVATDLLLVLLAVAVAIDLGRRRQRWVPAPAPLQVALLVLVTATAAGVVVGKLGGGQTKDILNDGRNLVYLIAIPLLTQQVVRTRRDIVKVVHCLAGLAILKGAVGLVGFALGKGRSIEGTHLTYYDPTANFVMLVFLSSLVAARVAKVPVPRWMWAGSPLAALCLLLSFRRSFWIAAVLAWLLVIVLAASRRSRPLVILGVVGAAVAIALSVTSFSAGGPQDTSSTGLSARVAQLSPSTINQSDDDRYRLDEIHNVLHAIDQNPVTGLGLGVPWTEVYPLSQIHTGGTLYTHVNVLWFTMKMGPLGGAGYVLWYAAAAMLAWRAWRRHPDALVRVFALGSLVSFAGLAVAELTASFTGVDPRLTLIVGALVGVLGAASRAAPSGWAADGVPIGVDGALGHGGHVEGLADPAGLPAGG
jgi:hypothetical protein